MEQRISLDRHLIRNREATFFFRVEGDSMRDAGVFDGDLLVVDRSLTAVNRDVVVAVVDGSLAVKELVITPGGYTLHAANSAYDDIVLKEGGELQVWGVVCWAIHRLAHER
jgi:DNA polymerase V